MSNWERMPNDPQIKFQYCTISFIFFESQVINLRKGNRANIHLLNVYRRHKRYRSYFYLFIFSFEELSPQRFKFAISVETVKPFRYTKHFCVLQLPIKNYWVSLVLYGYHNQSLFNNIYQMKHFSAVKLTWVMGRVLAFLWYQISKHLKKMDGLI